MPRRKIDAATDDLNRVNFNLTPEVDRQWKVAVELQKKGNAAARITDFILLQIMEARIQFGAEFDRLATERRINAPEYKPRREFEGRTIRASELTEDEPAPVVPLNN